MFLTALMYVRMYWKVALGAIAALIPIMGYLVGRRDGKNGQQNKHLSETIEQERTKLKFYKDLKAQHEKIDRPNNADDLAKRLRDGKF